MRRPMCDFVDLAKLAEAAGFSARSFTPVETTAGAERLGDLPPDAIIAVVFGPDGATFPVTAGILQRRIAATVPEHVRDFASWLAVAHLRCLVDDPDYPSWAASTTMAASAWQRPAVTNPSTLGPGVQATYKRKADPQ